MKSLITLLLCVVTFAQAADELKEISKASKKPFDVEAEVEAFYVLLTDTDPKIREQVEVLTTKARADYGGIYHAFAPKVIEWIPSESNWDVMKGSDMTGQYLVIQRIGYGRGKHAGADMALVAEFSVVYESVTKPDPKHPDEPGVFDSNKITITFRGFREPELSPTKKAQ